jgi:flagellar protein FlbB
MSCSLPKNEQKNTLKENSLLNLEGVEQFINLRVIEEELLIYLEQKIKQETISGDEYRKLFNEIEQFGIKKFYGTEQYRNLIREIGDTRQSIEENVRVLNGMPPERAVAILSAMDDQDVIMILRKTDEKAQSEGSISIVPYWLSLMESEWARELLRKLADKPYGNEKEDEFWNFEYRHMKIEK